MGDNHTLLVRLIPANRGAVPVESTVPKGPHTQETMGNAGPAPTFEDLLSNGHDEDLFDYYATSQLAHVDLTGQGKPYPSENFSHLHQRSIVSGRQSLAGDSSSQTILLSDSRNVLSTTS